MKYERSEKQKYLDKKKGDEAESDFMIEIGKQGGYSTTTGRVPLDSMAYPRVNCPPRENISPQKLLHYRFTAPDVHFWFKDYPAISLAQIKAKELQGCIIDGTAHFILDEKQLYQINEAAQTGAMVFLVVRCRALEAIPGLSEFSFVSSRDLQRDRIELSKATMWGKPVFKIPLHVFSPLSEIKGALIRGHDDLSGIYGGSREEAYCQPPFAA